MKNHTLNITWIAVAIITLAVAVHSSPVVAFTDVPATIGLAV